jgi:hypothetical protein
MQSWPKYPLIYEINTWVWLRELGEKYASVTFGVGSRVFPRTDGPHLRGF